MILISGVMSIIMQKNVFCTNKICLIYFFPNCISFCLKTFIFFIFGRATAPLPPPRLCAYAMQMHLRMHAGKSICQRNWSCRQDNKFYLKLHWQKFPFFWLKWDLFLNVCVCSCHCFIFCITSRFAYMKHHFCWKLILIFLYLTAN